VTVVVVSSFSSAGSSMMQFGLEALPCRCRMWRSKIWGVSWKEPSRLPWVSVAGPEGCFGVQLVVHAGLTPRVIVVIFREVVVEYRVECSLGRLVMIGPDGCLRPIPWPSG
jgi:hypothetical protein